MKIELVLEGELETIEFLKSKNPDWFGVKLSWYSPRFVSQMKSSFFYEGKQHSIDPSKRKWNAENKAWWFANSERGVVEKYIQHLFGKGIAAAADWKSADNTSADEAADEAPVADQPIEQAADVVAAAFDKPVPSPLEFTAVTTPAAQTRPVNFSSIFDLGGLAELHIHALKQEDVEFSKKFDRIQFVKEYAAEGVARRQSQGMTLAQAQYTICREFGYAIDGRRFETAFQEMLRRKLADGIQSFGDKAYPLSPKQWDAYLEAF